MELIQCIYPRSNKYKKKGTNLGTKIKGHKISILRFTITIVLIAEYENDWEQTINAVVETHINYKDLNMEVNEQKTTILVRCTRKGNPH